MKCAVPLENCFVPPDNVIMVLPNEKKRRRGSKYLTRLELPHSYREPALFIYSDTLRRVWIDGSLPCYTYPTYLLLRIFTSCLIVFCNAIAFGKEDFDNSL